MYDNDCVIAINKKNEESLYLKADEILKLINDTKRPIKLNKKAKYTYIELGDVPTNKKLNVSNIQDMSVEELLELRDKFFQAKNPRLQDFEELILEIEKRTNC